MVNCRQEAMASTADAIVARAEAAGLSGISAAVALCRTRPSKRSKRDMKHFVSQFVTRNHERLAVFADMKQHLLLKLAGLMRVQVISKGTVLYKCGTIGNIMHILVDGKMGVYIPLRDRQPSRSSSSSSKPATAASWMIDETTASRVNDAHEAVIEVKRACCVLPGASHPALVRVGACNTEAIPEDPGVPTSLKPALLALYDCRIARASAAVRYSRALCGTAQRLSAANTAAPIDKADASDSKRQATGYSPGSGSPMRKGSLRRQVTSQRKRSMRSSIPGSSWIPDIAGASSWVECNGQSVGGGQEYKPPAYWLGLMQRPAMRPTYASAAAAAEAILASGSGEEALIDASEAALAIEGEHRVATIVAPKAFGEVALKSASRKRTATIVADSDCIAFTVSLQDILDHTSIAGILATNTELFNFLVKQSWTACARRDVLTVLAYSLRPVNVPAGSMLVQEGELSAVLYVLRSGRCHVLVSGDDAAVRTAARHATASGMKLGNAAGARHRRYVIGELGPGAVVGERQCLLGVAEEFAVLAMSDLEVLEISREQLEPVLAACGNNILAEMAAKDHLYAKTLQCAARHTSSAFLRLLRVQVGTGRHTTNFVDAGRPAELTVVPQPTAAQTAVRATEGVERDGGKKVWAQEPRAIMSHLNVSTLLSKQLFRTLTQSSFGTEHPPRLQADATPFSTVATLHGRPSHASGANQSVAQEHPSPALPMHSMSRSRLSRMQSLTSADLEGMSRNPSTNIVTLATADGGSIVLLSTDEQGSPPDLTRSASAGTNMLPSSTSHRQPVASNLPGAASGLIQPDQAAAIHRTRSGMVSCGQRLDRGGFQSAGKASPADYAAKRQAARRTVRRQSITSMISGVIEVDEEGETDSGMLVRPRPTASRLNQDQLLGRGSSLRVRVIGSKSIPKHGTTVAGANADQALRQIFSLPALTPQDVGDSTPMAEPISTALSRRIAPQRTPLPVAGDTGAHAWRGRHSVANVGAGFGIAARTSFAYHEPPLAEPRSPLRRPARTAPPGASRQTSPTPLQKAHAAVETQLRKFKALRRARHGGGVEDPERALDRPLPRSMRRMGIRVKR